MVKIVQKRHKRNKMKIDVNTIVLVLILLVLLFKKEKQEQTTAITSHPIIQIKNKQNEINNYKLIDSIYFAKRDSLRAIYNPK